MPDGWYDLPRDLTIAPKRGKIHNRLTPIESEHAAVPDLPSNDMLVYSDKDDLNGIEASSDTVFDEHMQDP